MRNLLPEWVILPFFEYLAEQAFIDYLFSVVLVAHQGDLLIGLGKLVVAKLNTLADGHFGDHSAYLVESNEVGLALPALLVELPLHF